MKSRHYKEINKLFNAAPATGYSGSIDMWMLEITPVIDYTIHQLRHVQESLNEDDIIVSIPKYLSKYVGNGACKYKTEVTNEDSDKIIIYGVTNLKSVYNANGTEYMDYYDIPCSDDSSNIRGYDSVSFIEEDEPTKYYVEITIQNANLIKINRCLYPGSFDPFTNGHLSVLEKAVKMFDEVYIVISTNPFKKSRFTVESRIDAITEMLCTKYYYLTDKIRIFASEDTIPARIAQKYNCQYIVRGIRNNMDYEYEEGLAAWNKEYDPTIETVYVRADNSNISSTMVNAFMNENVDVIKYLPYAPGILERVK